MDCPPAHIRRPSARLPRRAGRGQVPPGARSRPPTGSARARRPGAAALPPRPLWVAPSRRGRAARWAAGRGRAASGCLAGCPPRGVAPAEAWGGCGRGGRARWRGKPAGGSVGRRRLDRGEPAAAAAGIGTAGPIRIYPLKTLNLMREKHIKSVDKINARSFNLMRELCMLVRRCCPWFLPSSSRDAYVIQRTRVHDWRWVTQSSSRGSIHFFPAKLCSTPCSSKLRPMMTVKADYNQ